MNDNRKLLYDTMKSQGVDLGTFEDYDKAMDDKVNRQLLFESLHNSGYDVGDWDSFDEAIGIKDIMPKKQPINVPAQDAATSDTKQYKTDIAGADKVVYGPTAESENVIINGNPVEDVRPQEDFSFSAVQQRLLENNEGIVQGDRPAVRVPDAISGYDPSVQSSITQNAGQQRNLREQLFNMRNDINTRLGAARDSKKDAENSLDLSRTKDDIRLLRTAKRQLEDADEKIKEADIAIIKGRGKTGFGGAGRAFVNDVFDPNTWDFGFTDYRDARNVQNVLNKADNGEELTESEQNMLDAYAVNMAADAVFGSRIGRWYKAGQVTAEALPFMLEFAINPAAGIGTTMQNQLVRYAIKRFGSEALRTGIRNVGFVAAKAGTRALGDLVGSAVMSGTTGLLRTSADARQRMAGNIQYDTNEEGQVEYAGHTPGEDAATARRKAFAASTIENWSEMVGNYLRPVGKAAGKAVAKAAEGTVLQGTIDALEGIGTRGLGKIVSNLESKAQWHGSVGEFLEEEIGGIANALVVGDQTLDNVPETGVFNGSNMLDTFMGVALMGGFVSGVKTASWGYHQSQRGKMSDLKKADNNASIVIGSDWQQIKENFDNQDSPEGMKNAVNQYLSQEPDKRKRDAVLQYVRSQMELTGSLIAQGKEMLANDEDGNSDYNDVQMSFDDGYNLTDPQAMHDAQLELDNAQARLRDALGVEDITLENLMLGDLEEYTPEEKQIGLDYLNAKAAYDGMIYKANDTIDQQVEIENRLIDSHTHVDTQSVYPSTMKAYDRKAYIVGGRFTLNDDGSFDMDNTDGSLVVIYEDGTREMVSPDAILSVDDTLSPEALKSINVQTITEEVRQSEGNKIDGTLQFQPGMVINVMDENGNPGQIQIAQNEQGLVDNGDGTVNVLLVDEKGNQPVSPMSIDEIQAGYDMSRRAELAAQKAQQQAESITPVVPVPQYNFGDQLTFRDGSVGEIISEPDEDGRMQIDVTLPDGDIKVWNLTADEITDRVSVPEMAESVPEMDNSVPETDENVPEMNDNPQTAFDRLAKDSNNNPVYEDSVKEDTWASLVEDTGGDEAVAKQVVKDMLFDAKKALDKATKSAGKELKGATPREKIQAAMAAKKTVDDAQKIVDYWQSVVDYIDELEKSRAQAAAILESARSRELKEPMSIRQVVANYIRDNYKKLIHSLNREDFMRETGWGAAEAKPFSFLWAKKGTGTTLVKLAERIAEDDNSGLVPMMGDAEQMDTQTVRNALIDVFTSVSKPSDIMNLTEEENRQFQQEMDEYAQEIQRQPIGATKYGDVFQWTPGNAQGAATLLEGLQQGYIKNVFNSPKYGPVDMIWGDKEKGLDHIIEKHITKYADFKDINDALLKIDDIISNGTDFDESDNTKIRIRKDGYLVSLAKSPEGTWVITAFNEMESQGKKKNKSNLSASLVTASQTPNSDESRAVDSKDSLVSDSKDTNISETSNNVAENVSANIAQARQEVNVEPTEGQKKAGNYKMGHIKLDGYDISLENPKGSVRKGVDENGKAWESEMKNDYGYLRGTEGVDGDHIDVFLSDTPDQGDVFVVDQVNPKTGEFDEHKVMYGFNSVEEARAAYLANYEEGWQGLGNITPVSKDEFKKWIDSSHRKTKPFAEYASVKPLADNSTEIEGIETESTNNVNNSTKIVDSSSLTDAIRALYEKGKEYASKLYQMKYFDVASTPDFMKQIGLTGERFTIKYGVLSRHIGKDESHTLPESVWSELPEAIQNPFAITRRTDKEAGYRLYTAIKTDKGYVVVGVDVKNAGKDIEVNSISTVFEREGGITQNEEVIYSSEGITPEQQSLLKRPNSSQYTAGQELSESKGSEIPGISKSIERERQDAQETEESVPDSTESVPKQPLGTIRTGKHTKTGEDLWIVTPADRVSKEEFTRLKAEAKKRDGYYSSFKPNNGFIFKTEEDAKAFNTENANLSEQQPTSLADVKAVVGTSVETVEPEARDNGVPEEIKPKWKYGIYVQQGGRTVITRDDVSGLIPLGDGRFRIEAENPVEMKSILEHNGLTDILEDIGSTLEAKIEHHNFRIKAETEGFHGYKIGDKILYKYRDGREEDPGVVKDFEEWGEHLPVIDTGLAPVMYEVAHLDQIRHAETEQEQPKQEEKPVNPSGNKLVTDERYADLRRRMLDKLKGQMNMGIDPEILAIGTEMAVYHIEKGARKFAEFAKAMIQDLSDAIRPYLKAFYNGARDLPEMSELSKEMTPYDEVSSFDVANFDKQSIDAMATAEEVVKEKEVEKQAEEGAVKLKTITIDLTARKSEEKSVSSQGETVSNEEKTARRAFSSAIATDMLAALETGERPYKSIVNLREKARQAGMQVGDEGRDDILIQELVEDGLVKAARFVVSQGLYGGSKSKECFSAICKLYEMQPTIASRSSNRIKMQQYSTPLPMGFVADMFAYYKGKTHTVLEPTAGNGMLVFAVPAQAVHANELDKTRLENLMLQGFGLVTSQDATLPIRDGQRIYDAVIANPPFGAAEAKVYDGKEISGLDPQITLNALSNMKDDGKAAIIIGGNLEYGPNGAIKGKKSFITYLYDHYNVKGIVDMEGQLYQRQGTTYPTMMILIDGRRTEEERAQTAVYPPVKANAVRKAETFDDLYDIVTEIISSTDKTNGTEILRQSEPMLDLFGEQNTDLSHDNHKHNENASNGRSRRNSNSEGITGGNRKTSSKGDSKTNGISGNGVQRLGVSKLPGQEENTRRDESGTIDEGGRGNVSQRTGGSDVVGGVQDVGNAGNGNGLIRERKADKQQVKRDLNTEKLPYRPHNTAFSLESVAPAAMVEAMDRTLSAIEEEHGSIDEYVRSELGYDTIDDAHNALAAEQMDAVAMAIVQMKKGEALIIGDQTGVGKGRQMASLIRWAVMQGQKPIFITQKADLFTDIYRDLVDIGSGDLRPFIFNDDGAIVAQNKKGKDGKPLVVHKPASKSIQAKVFASGQLPDEYDFAVLTYSQVNTGDAISQQEAEAVAKENAKETGSRSFGSKKSKSVKNAKPTPKATFLRALAEDNYLLLDESHTAAGSSNTGMYLQSILKTARAATFASATFAKRPDTMPLYAIRTAMSKAKVKINELITIIENGGVTLQEIMSRALTEAGQMVRRERDMSDVVTDWKTITDPATVQRARENYDKTIEAFNDIIKYQQDYVKPRIDDLSASLAVTASSANVKKGTDKMGVENVPFASKTYNYTKQLMLALKVDAIADEVDAQIKAGLHPVIALESTMESSIKDYSPGEVIPEPTFSASLLKGLDSCMQYTVKDDEGKETHRTFSPQSLGPDAEQAYYELRDKIREATSDIFISPLDAIISKLEAKGYKVGELTGRNSVVEIDDKGRAVVKKRTDKDKKLMQAQFNDGTLDVLILNKSASTGISLHASKKFKDQRQRAMIIAQPLSDINDYMQMIGRIDRTGQVHRGYYINLGLPVPAEQRFLMMLATKLKSLNANTTTAQESESNNVDAPDLLNKYGSQVVIEYLRDNPDIYTKMGEPLKKRGNGTTATVHANELDEYKPDEEDARKITGYVALLNTNEQEAFYNEVVKRYVDLITYLNDIGENDLKITVMPLRAQTLSKKVSSEGMDPNGENPFAQHAYVEEVEMDVLREPMKADEIRKLIDNLYGEIPEEEKGKPFRERFARMQTLRSRIEAETETKLQKEEARYEAAKARSADDIARNTERVNRNQKLSDEDKARAIASYIEDTNDKIETQHQENVEKIHRVQESFIRRVGMFHPGETYIIPDQLETPSIAFFSHGIFCGLKTGDKKMTPSTTTAIFATNDARRKVEVKLSQFSIINNIHGLTMQNFGQTQEVNLDNWDAQRPNDRRKKGFIMTGNILQAIADTKDKNGNYQGQLISFTDIDGNVRDGILMPDKWNPTQLTTSGVPILARLQEIRSGRLVTSIDNAVTIQGGYQNIFYTLRVPKTKAAGGFIFQNDDIVNLTNGGSGFYQSRGQLQADIPSDNIDELVRLLSNLGVKVEGKNEAKQDTNRYRSAAPSDVITAEYPFKELRRQWIEDGEIYNAAEANDILQQLLEDFPDFEPAFARFIEMNEKNRDAFWETGGRDVEFEEEQLQDAFNAALDEEIINAVNPDFDNAERFRIREKDAPEKTGIGYKVFVVKNGLLYPPMVANPNGASTPTGVWLDADAAPISGQSKTGRPQVKAGGKGTQGGSGQLAYRPGWHLGEIPYALQFNRKGDLFPKNFVWAEVEYAADRNYQQEAEAEGMTENGKYRHSYAGLKHLPEDGFYTYRTNPNPETDPWIITGAMRVKRILKPSEVDEIVRKADRLPQKREQGAFTDEQIDALNAEIESRSNTDYDAMEAKAKEFAGVLGVKVRTVRDLYDIIDENRAKQSRMRSSKGWYDTETGEITVVVPNNDSVADVEATILHEIVGHKGMRQIVGENNYNDFLDKVYAAADIKLRERITDLAKKHGWDFRLATEEYIAELSEEGFNDRLERNLLEKIRDLVVDMFRRAKIAIGFHINDNDLRYMLWRSYRNRAKGAMGTAEDVVMQTRLGVGNYRNLYNFANNDRRRNQKNDDDRSERNDGTRVAGDNAKRLGAKHTLGDTGMFEEELAARRSRYSEADGSNHIEEQIGASFIDVAKRTGRFIPWEEAVSSGIKLNGNTKESICFVSDDHKKITKLKDPYAASATKGNSPFDIIEELIVHNELFPDTAYRLVGITQDRHGDMRFVLEQDFVKYESFADENDIADYLQSLGLKDEGRFIFGNDKYAILDAYGENVLVDENDRLRFIDPIIKIKPQPGDNLRYRSGDARAQYENETRVTNQKGEKTLTANFWRRFYEGQVDKMASLKSLQNAIIEETGDEIKSHEDAYTYENHMGSKHQARSVEYNRDFFKPMIATIRGILKDDEDFHKAELYAVAKHGLERNRLMSKREAEKDGGVWDGTIKDYSGLTSLTGSKDDFTQIAEDMVFDFESTHNVKPMWDAINAATKKTLRQTFLDGLISKDRYEMIRDMYDYYIPLRGWAERTAEQEYEYLDSSNRRRENINKAAKGRTSLADNPFAEIMKMADDAIASGLRNKMKQRFMNLAVNHPTSLLTVSEQWYVQNPVTGQWEAQRPNINENTPSENIADIVDQFEKDMKAAEAQGLASRRKAGMDIGKPITAFQESEHMVSVRRGGKEYVVYVNGNPRAAQAVNGRTNPDRPQSDNLAGKLRDAAQAVKNFQARVYTTLKPAFIFSNMSRDAIMALTSVSIKEDRAYASRFRKNLSSNLFRTYSLVSKFNKGKLNDSDPIEKYFAEFIHNGGETGYTRLLNMEEYKKNLENMVKSLTDDPNALVKVWRSTWDGIEFLNRCAEDITRFATFMTSRQQGRTVQQSISDAKEITVNFNRKGSGEYLGQTANYLYIFYNAAVQSLANVGRLIHTHPGRTAAAFGVFLSAGFLMPLLNAFINSMCSGDDDDDAYWDLPEWTRRNNFCVRIPFTNKFITIPIGHELRPFYAVGEIALSCLVGKEDYDDGVKDAAEALAGLLPIDFTGNGGDMVVNLTPTFVQPLVQWSRNKTYFGTPIYKDTPYNQLDPDYTKAYKGTSTLLVNTAKFLNDITGGDIIDKGWIDMNPAIMEHLIEGYFGGVGTTINQIGKTVSMAWNDDMRQIRNVPVVSSFLQEADERSSGSQLNREYYDYLDEVEMIQHRISGIKKQIRIGNMTEEDLEEYQSRPEVMLYQEALKPRINEITKLYKEMNEQPEEEREEYQQAITDLMREVVELVNRNEN